MPVEIKQQCPQCRGRGHLDGGVLGDPLKDCPQCNRSGEITLTVPSMEDFAQLKAELTELQAQLAELQASIEVADANRRLGIGQP